MEGNNNLGRILKQRRMMKSLTLCELAHASDVSPSHLARIEKAERFPSARILRRLALPLGFKETELLALAGYLSFQSESVTEEAHKRLDPYVAEMLSEEPVETQRAVVELMTLWKDILKTESRDEKLRGLITLVGRIRSSS